MGRLPLVLSLALVVAGAGPAVAAHAPTTQRSSRSHKQVVASGRHRAAQARRTARPLVGLVTGPSRAAGRSLVEQAGVEADTGPPAVAPTDAHGRRVAELQERLSALLRERGLGRSRVGVEVMTASAGDVLFAHNSDALFNPASNTKMLTTAAALSELGGDYRYRTRVFGGAPDEQGVVHGDIDLRGAGDPSLTTSDLAELARAVSARGVTSIEGSVFADGRFRDPTHPNQSVGDQALILNRNSYTIRVRPTAVGHVAAVTLEPEADYFTVRNEVKTVAGKRSRVRVDVSQEGDRLEVIVRGRVGLRGEARVRQRIGNAAIFAAATLRRALVDFGVEVKGGVRYGGLPGETPLLAEHLSAPLSEICRVSNKDSNNFVAETIFKTVGGERYGVPGTLAKGQKAVAELMSPLGFGAGSYRILNGSGLTHENRIAPSGLARLLRHLYFDLSVAPEFLASLAVGGVDGTIRNRFRGTDAVGLVRAKTGTLSGVSALSGYVGDSGEVLIFSILVEGFRHRRLAEVRHAQVRMVQAMLHYLRADSPRAAAPPPAADTEQLELPGDDSEDDGDASGGAGGGG